MELKDFAFIYDSDGKEVAKIELPMTKKFTSYLDGSSSCTLYDCNDNEICEITHLGFNCNCELTNPLGLIKSI